MQPVSNQLDEPETEHAVVSVEEAPGEDGRPELPTVTDGKLLESHSGDRVRVVGRFHKGGYGHPPKSHPIVNTIVVGSTRITAYTTAPLEDRFADCEVVAIATVLVWVGPVKDGGNTGRIYEPRREVGLQVEEIVACTPLPEQVLE